MTGRRYTPGIFALIRGTDSWGSADIDVARHSELCSAMARRCSELCAGRKHQIVYVRPSNPGERDGLFELDMGRLVPLGDDGERPVPLDVAHIIEIAERAAAEFLSRR